jgi:hypothetical protein
MRYDTSNWWGDQTPIAVCIRCGRYMRDPNRDSAGDPKPEDPDDDRELVCLDCLEEAIVDNLKRVMEEVIDERLDLGEEDRASLKKVVELVVTEPQKVLELKDLGNKVRALEEWNGFLWRVLVFEGALLGVLLAAVVAIALGVVP